MKKGMRIALVAGVSIAAVVLVGCSTGTDDADSGSSESSAASDGLLGTVETEFGTVEIPEPEDGELTVVTLGWSDAEVALALGVVPVGVYDWQGFGEENKGVGSWATDLFGDVEPTILANVGDELDYETIQSLEPDVILNTRSTADEAVYNRLTEIAPTVYAPEGTGSFATSWDVQTQLIADALGKSDEGEALVADVQDQIDAAKSDNPQFAGHTAVTGTKFGDQYGAYISGDFRWDLIEDLGFEQNPAVLELEPSGFYVALSAEQVSALDADVAVLFPIGYTLDELKADSLIGALNVVKEDRTVFLAATDEVAQAFSAASPLSIPIAIEGIVPQLAEIVE